MYDDCSAGLYAETLLRPADRLVHLVLVDGRLVDVWGEAIEGTRWQHHADRFDRELQRPAPPKPVPTYERALAWLDGVCGGRAAVLALEGLPLVDEGRDLMAAANPTTQARLTAVADLLDAVTQRCLDPEAGVALRTALLRVHADEPEVVTEAASAAKAAGGLVWAVGRANGLLRPQGDLRMGRVQEELGLSSAISTYGKVVERALVGYRDPVPVHERTWPTWRPDGLPDLLALGHADLLVGAVRRRLVRVRERALEAQAVSAA